MIEMSSREADILTGLVSIKKSLGKSKELGEIIQKELITFGNCT